MKLTPKQKKELERIAAIPADKIDTSDIPERTDFSGGFRGKFTRSETRLISIRLSEEDLEMANRLAVRKGLPYQTYLKSLLHQALTSESQRS